MCKLLITYKNLCQTAPSLSRIHFSSLNGFICLSATMQVNLDFHLLSINERKTRAGNSIIELRLNAENTPVQETSCQLYHSPLLHAFLRPMICMHPFLFCFYDFLIFCVIVWFFIPICFICLFPVFGWMHFLCVLSLPVQCWSLSYGKQRRPFRLCAPT